MIVVERRVPTARRRSPTSASSTGMGRTPGANGWATWHVRPPVG